MNAGGSSNRCSQGMGYWIICTAEYSPESLLAAISMLSVINLCTIADKKSNSHPLCCVSSEKQKGFPLFSS